LPENYAYLYGNPVKVHVPVDTATNGLMIVGAYPTAHFNTIDGVADVPVSDHLYPFSSEKYFDGSRVRPVNSGKELEEFYLKPLGIKREDCWITDLVKVFLFKQGHIDRYEKLEKKDAEATRDDFGKFAKRSLGFLQREVELAQPKAILLLGLEVVSVVLNCSESRARDLIPSSFIKQDSPMYATFFALPHPGIVMRQSEHGIYWKNRLEQELIPGIRSFIALT